MKLEDHKKLDEIMFGPKSYTEIHQWIDECFGDYAWGGKYEKMGNAYYHWSERHNHEAIKEKYGYETPEYNSAKLHVIADWLTHFGCPEFPKNREEVIKLLDKKLGLA